MSQGHLFDFAEAARCGYCDRPLQPDPDEPGTFSCPRCATRLRRLGGGSRKYYDFLVEFAAFQREAYQDRGRR